MIHISSRNSWAKTFLPVAQCGPTAKDFLMRLSSPSKGKETWHEENIYGAVMGSLSQLVGLTSVQFICCLQFIHHPQMFQQLFFVEKVEAKDNPFNAPPAQVDYQNFMGGGRPRRSDAEIILCCEEIAQSMEKAFRLRSWSLSIELVYYNEKSHACLQARISEVQGQHCLAAYCRAVISCYNWPTHFTTTVRGWHITSQWTISPSGVYW